MRVPPLPDAPAPKAETSVAPADAEMIRKAVIYRDDHIIALNKPPGLPTQGGSKQTRHVDGLAEALKFDLEEKPRLVHRLDKDTSGVLLLARTRAVAADLTKAFRARDTRKIYWAAVAGTPLPRMGTIRFRPCEGPRPWRERRGREDARGASPARSMQRPVRSTPPPTMRSCPPWAPAPPGSLWCR